MLLDIPTAIIAVLLSVMAAPIDKQGDNVVFVVQSKGTLWAKGPALLRGTITNTSQDEISIIPIGGPTIQYNLVIEAPAAWVHQEVKPISWAGQLPQPIKLQKGEKYDFTINLLDFFREIPAGSSQLKFKFSIWTYGSSPSLLAKIEKDISVVIVRETEKEIGLRIARMFHSLDSMDYAARAEIYRQGLAIRSPAVMPLFIRGLSDPAARMLLNEINWALGNMSEPDNMGPLVDYLAESGAANHQYIFSIWKNRHIQLTDDQFLKLRSARNPWIRLFLIDLHPSQLEDADIEHLGTEIKQLRQALEEAKKANQSSSQVAQPQSQGGMVPAERPFAPQPPSQ